jgi:hypothetical protein
MWRRGITRAQRLRTSDLPADDDGNHPWKYFLIYRSRGSAGVARRVEARFRVERVVAEREWHAIVMAKPPIPPQRKSSG